MQRNDDSDGFSRERGRPAQYRGGPRPSRRGPSKSSMLLQLAHFSTKHRRKSAQHPAPVRRV